MFKQPIIFTARATQRWASAASQRQHLTMLSTPRGTSFSAGRCYTSSSQASSSYSPVEWWRGRQERKEEEKYKERINFMANKDEWTIGDMKDELEEVVKSWTAKMPVIGSSKEVTIAKQMYKSVESLGNTMGLDATADSLANMARTEKLKTAVSAESSVEDINILLQQFETMSLMHKVVRKRHLEGRKIPETAEAVQAVMQVEAQQLLDKRQKNKMAGRTREIMRKSRGRR